MKYIRLFLYVFFVPFACLSLAWNLLRINSKAKKYLKDKTRYSYEKRFYWVNKIVSRVLYIKRIDVESYGKKFISQKPTLFVCNHKSNIDPLLMISVFHSHMNMYDPKFQFVFIAKNELNKKHNPVTSILNLIDSVYLDRADLRQQFQALQKQIEILKQKKSIVVFIEGHRYFTDEFGEFKAGALRVAYDTHSNIQPVIIYGSSGMLDKNKSNRNKKRTAYVEILKPLVPHDYNSHSASFISEELKNQMQKRYNTIRNKVKANKSPFGD